MALEKGTKLGPYVIQSPLGSGGMGEVYVARDTRLGRDVAVKVLPANLSRDPDALSRFEKEARALAALSHPNLLTIYDFGLDNEIHYAVMELLSGETLRSKLEGGPLPYEQILQIGIGVAEGLAAAHASGIIHRDLKPDNIFVTQDQRVKILDFGLVRWNVSVPEEDVTGAQTLPPVTGTGTVMGTVHYMSPEQVRGKEVDPRTDIFSFGSVLYELATGKRAFEMETNAETMVAILRFDPPGLLSATRIIPPDIERVIRSCLEKDPAHRFQSSHDLVLALKMLKAGSGMYLPLPDVTPKKGRRSKTIESIAILPFSNAGTDPDTDYIADGLTENLINTLSQIPKLRVMARSTVFRYKGNHVDPRTAGRELGVRAIMTGRVLQRADKINIQVELVDVTDGAQMWGEQFSRPAHELQEIQQEIAASISKKLKIRVIGSRKIRLAKRYTQNDLAYSLYLQGRFHWNKRTGESIRKAVEYMEEAIQFDSGFALAYAGLADCYSVMGGFGFMSLKEAYPKAKKNALKALELDPELAEALTALATVQERWDWDWQGAEESFREAIRINPGYATAHQWYSVFLTMLTRFKESENEIENAMELDPLSVVMNWTRGYLLYYMRRYSDAVEQLKKAIELDPYFLRPQFDLGVTYFISGDLSAAANEFNVWMKKSGETPSRSLQGFAYAAMGRKEEALQIANELRDQKRDDISRFSIAVIYAALGMKQDALDLLEEAYEWHEDGMISLRINPRVDSLRSEPRFKSLLQRLNL